MILTLETNSKTYAIAISAEQEPFAELRRVLRDLPGGIWAERIVCDREARHWLDVHAIKSRDGETAVVLGCMRRYAGSDEIVTVFDHGIPIEIMDDEAVA